MFLCSKNFSYKSKKLPSVVPADPGRGFALDKRLTNVCAAIKSMIKNSGFQNDFDIKNGTKHKHIFCKTEYT